MDRMGAMLTATVTNGKESWATCQEPDCNWIGSKYTVGDKRAVDEAASHGVEHLNIIKN